MALTKVLVSGENKPVTIPKTVKNNGTSFMVTVLKAGVFKGNKEALKKIFNEIKPLHSVLACTAVLFAVVIIAIIARTMNVSDLIIYYTFRKTWRKSTQKFFIYNNLDEKNYFFA